MWSRQQSLVGTGPILQAYFKPKALYQICLLSANAMEYYCVPVSSRLKQPFREKGKRVIGSRNSSLQESGSSKNLQDPQGHYPKISEQLLRRLKAWG